jgi:2-polyprenyl-6-hydroxyphenyl methylase/3-demethylubiquinone-9 3-methyltransferase
MGFDVTGVDPSTSGIAVANKAYPGLKLYEGNAYDDFAGRLGRFPLVVSLEVIEHCFYPRKYVQTVFDLLEERGKGIISTPIMATGKIWPWRLPASGMPI